MATVALTSLDQYLATTYRPDCDYVDGELQERSVGKFDHSNFQRALILYLGLREREWNVRALPEQRLRISATRVRIPDVCIVSREQPVEQILTQPPLVCIEILSEGDTLNSHRSRLNDYVNFGVNNLWIFEPTTREAWIYVQNEYQPAPNVIPVEGTAIAVELGGILAYLD